MGDNDTLSALVAQSVKADLLVLLSDIDGLYTADPKKDKNASLISTVSEITEQIEALAGNPGALGTGGMKTKLKAGKICMDAGCDMVIANGEEPEILYEIVSGTARNCTRFIAK